jgi:hypothetical protein
MDDGYGDSHSDGEILCPGWRDTILLEIDYVNESETLAIPYVSPPEKTGLLQDRMNMLRNDAGQSGLFCHTQ